MKTISNPSRAKWAKLTERPLIKQQKLMRSAERIFYDIQRKGDKALLAYSREFDCPDQETVSVDSATIERSSLMVTETLKQAIKIAGKNIATFHRAQQEKRIDVETSPGIICWRETRPIESVGIYIPGGTAPLFSTVLMLAIPAKIAGCSE